MMRSLRRGWKRALLAAYLTFVFGLGLVAALWALFPFPLERLEGYPASARVLDGDGRLLRVARSARQEVRLPVELDAISPWIARATIAVEDRRFRSHRGVDVLAVGRAMAQNLWRLEVHSGASTLTMQLIRMLDRRPRTLRAKVVEAFRALQLESRLSKDAILAAYLNLAPYGGNLRGVEAAARRYFGRSAADLSLGEAALLAGIPQSPSRLRPDRHYERALARRRVVLRAMADADMITAKQLEDALRSRPVVRAHPWPFRAPHAAAIVLSRAVSTPGRAVRTTLDPLAQSSAEAHLRGALEHGPLASSRLGGAIVVIRVTDGDVRALVGSPDFFDTRRRGQVNGATARRSPGSTLKPFLYGLAFDRGVASPTSYLADVEGHFGAYQPENFERRFLGPVPASEALALSLNLPAVRLQSRLGTSDFLACLRALGLRTLDRPAPEYGLTLCLGGGEVRLMDLTNAYASLVRLGVHLPWRLEAGSPRATARRVLTPGAARLVLEALSTPPHLGRVDGLVRRPGEARWGYKTGTSFGLRDAWAVAFNTELVVGVWLGEPSGRPSPELVGVEAAAPIAASLLRDLSRRTATEWPAAPDLEPALVCSVSGHPLGQYCPSGKECRVPASAPRLPTCQVHREVLVDPTRDLEICPLCRRGRGVERRIVEDWPGEVATWLRKVRRGTVPPPHDPTCPGVRGDHRGPRILRPAAGASYVYLHRAPFRQRLYFQASAAGGIRRLHWFVDGDLIATSAPQDRVAWPLRPGRHEIRCVDEQGRAAMATFSVGTWSRRGELD